MAHARLFSVSDTEKLIKDFFYNALVSFVLDQGPYNPDNLDQKLIQGIVIIIRTILERSQSTTCPGIQLTRGVIITKDNCPVKYKDFFSLLMSIKGKEPTPDDLNKIVFNITAFESFKELNPKQSLLEMAGVTKPVLNHVQYDTSNITAELIRESFYNEMVTQGLHAVEMHWLTADDIHDEESEIYIALPALTIFAAIQQSTTCDGIRLLNNKILTNTNFPPDDRLPAFTNGILAIKAMINTTFKNLTKDQCNTIKHMLASDAPLPDALIPYKNPELTRIVSAIKGMAIEISREQSFHQMSKKAIAVCSESLRPASKPAAR